MGLDAFVFCDCVEKGRLRIPHPYPRLLYISSSGSPEIRSNDPAMLQKHVDWMEMDPCQLKHETLMMDGDTLGNAGFINEIRERLERTLRPRSQYSVLLTKVLYCGTHTGDHLTIAQVRRLAIELRQLKRVLQGSVAADRRLIIPTINQLERLTRTSLRTMKPIAF